MSRLTITFIEIDSKPTLRITIQGQVTDFVLSLDQVKLLIRQMIKWLTK